MRHLLLLASFFFVLQTACSVGGQEGEDLNESDADVDADTDTDSDADADADSDADTDADVTDTADVSGN